MKLLLGLIFVSFLASFLASCGVPALPPPENGTLSWHESKHDGHLRKALVYMPEANPAAEAGHKSAAIYVLHGSMGSAEGMRDMVGAAFEALAIEHQFAVIYPEGIENHWNDCRGSADYAANTLNIDDPGYFAQLIPELAERFNIDAERSFITGLSNGGQMAFRIALERPGLFKAYAPMIASLSEDRTLDCKKSGEAVAIMMVNGTEDPINPYNGGIVSIMGNESRGVVRSTQDTVDYWRTLAGQNGEANLVTYPEKDGDEATSIEEQRWEAEGKPPVRLVTMHGSGHTFPSASNSLPWYVEWLLGGSAGDVDGAALTLNFFQQVQGSRHGL